MWQCPCLDDCNLSSTKIFLFVYQIAWFVINIKLDGCTAIFRTKITACTVQTVLLVVSNNFKCLLGDKYISGKRNLKYLHRIYIFFTILKSGEHNNLPLLGEHFVCIVWGLWALLSIIGKPTNQSYKCSEISKKKKQYH